MITKNQLIAFISFILLVFGLAFSSIASAKEINLYDQPKDGSKIVGTVDMTIGVIPIFTPKEGTWMKVGDPRNGNVGWIKSSDMSSGPGSPSSFTFTQQIINDSKGVPHSYQIIQYGNPVSTSNQPLQGLEQNQNTQQHIEGMMQNIVNGLNTFYKQQEKAMTGMGAPVIMPIVIMPPPKATTSNTNTKK